MAALTVEFPQVVWSIEFGGDETVVRQVTMTGGGGAGGGGVTVHNDLTGRSTADAHPITAITGLQAALDAVGPFQTVGWDFLYDGVNFDLSTDEIDGVPRTVVLAAGARVGTHELPLRAATESDAGQHWSIEYFCGGDGFTVLRVPDPLGHSPQYVDLAGLKADGWIVDMVGVWDSDTETGFWALHAIYDRRGDESGGGAVDSVNGQTGTVVLDAADVGAVDVALVGAPDGVAELDSGGLVPSSQLPSYVDDVIEAANFAALPGTGATGKIYVTLDNNLTFRWSGSAYVEISASLALGETSSTAYRGDRGKTAYDHSQVVAGNPHGTTAADVSVDASGFNGNLTTSDDTVQEVAQKLDDLVIPAAGIADPGGANDDFLQRKSGAWTNRTVAQVRTDLGVARGGILNHGQNALPSGRYISNSLAQASTAQNFTPNNLWFCPFVAPFDVTIDRLCVEVTTAGAASSLGRIGIYAVTGGVPAALIRDAGTFDGSALGVKELTLDPTVTLSGGTNYAFAFFHNSGSNMAMRVFSFVGAMQLSEAAAGGNVTSPRRSWNRSLTFTTLPDPAGTVTHETVLPVSFYMRGV